MSGGYRDEVVFQGALFPWHCQVVAFRKYEKLFDIEMMKEWIE
jgi:hypothetical protein